MECQREPLRHDDGYEWWKCRHCVLVWNERTTGVNWRPSTCLKRNGDQREELVYHGMLEDK